MLPPLADMGLRAISVFTDVEGVSGGVEGVGVGGGVAGRVASVGARGDVAAVGGAVGSGDAVVSEAAAVPSLPKSPSTLVGRCAPSGK